MSDLVLKERRGEVVVLTMNRPEKGNALNPALLDAVADSFRGLSGDRGARCVVLRGAGDRAFSFGMDLQVMFSLSPEENAELIGAGGPLRRALAAIEELSLPVLAMIRGYAAGAGCEMAVACDLRIGSEGCRMGMPPAKLGIVYPPEGIGRFVSRTGPATARRLFLTADYFQAREAYDMGLLDYLVEDERLEEFTMGLASRLVRNAPLSMAGQKRLLNMLGSDAVLSAEQYEEAEGLIHKAIESRDAAEALTAFEEKRPPEFEGD